MHILIHFIPFLLTKHYIKEHPLWRNMKILKQTENFAYRKDKTTQKQKGNVHGFCRQSEGKMW